MKITYYPKGTCSTKMEIEEKDGVIRKVKITDGCSGNLQGISRLLAACRWRKQFRVWKAFAAERNRLPVRISFQKHFENCSRRKIKKQSIPTEVRRKETDLVSASVAARK